MLATLIFGILAGAFSPHAESHVKSVLDGASLFDTPVSEMELKLFSFAVCLVAAAVLAGLFGNGSAVVLAVGAALGVFGPRIIERIQKRRAPDYGDDL